MKKIILIVFAISSFASAQVSIGAKAGLSYLAEGGMLESVESVYESSGEGNAGYHAGLFLRMKIARLYFQPELLYTTYQNEFETPLNGALEVKYQRIDLPLNLGLKFLKIARIQGGMVLSYYFEDEHELSGIQSFGQEDFTAGLQVGTGLDIGNLTLDLRYEFGFTERQTSFLFSGTSFQTENRPSLLHLSVGVKF